MAEVDTNDNEQTETIGEPTSAIPIGPQAETEDRKFLIDGAELPFEVINGMPMYQKDHVVDNRCKIFERIGWDDRVGATYLATAPDGKELVLRVGNEQVLIPQLEASFLCKIEQKNLWRSFSQVHSIWQGEQFYFLALYFRSGPQLSQCFSFCKSKFSLGTAGRLALDILQILRHVHDLGYLIRALYLEMFHFDACSRHLFLADLSTIRKDTSKVDSHCYELVMPHWCGGPTFAPMTHHDEDPISCRDELEAWLYLFIYLAKGTLPWENDSYDDIKWTKIKTINTGELFHNLPHQFHEILNVITHEGATRPVADAEYDKLKELTETIIHEIGGVEDEDENFDFERDPTEQEIPRFVVERKPIDEDQNDDITQSSRDDVDSPHED